MFVEYETSRPYPEETNTPARLEQLKLKCASRTSQSVTSMRNVMATRSIFQYMIGLQYSPLHLTGAAPILNFWHIPVNNLCFQGGFPRISGRKALRGFLCDSDPTGTLKHGHILVQHSWRVSLDETRTDRPVLTAVRNDRSVLFHTLN
jgi:hypothetical protein